MNRGQLRALSLSWLDDLAGTYFTAAQMDVFLNNGLRECQKQLIQAGQKYYTTRASTNLVINASTYALPSDFLKVDKLEICLDGTPPNENLQILLPVTLVQLGKFTWTTGTPEAYAMRKNCIVVGPIPDNNLTMYMDYTYAVQEMTTDGSMPDAPQQYHEYIAVLATIDGLLKDQRDPSAMLTKKDFYQKLMKEDAAERRVDTSRQVVITDPDWGPLY